MREQFVINSKKQADLYNLVGELGYVPYTALMAMYKGNKNNFKKDMKRLHSAGFINTIKLGKKVFVFQKQSDSLFDEKYHEILSWFYLKAVKSGGRVNIKEKKFISQTGHEFVFEVLPDVNSIKLYNEKNRFIAPLIKLQDKELPFNKCLSNVDF